MLMTLKKNNSQSVMVPVFGFKSVRGRLIFWFFVAAILPLVITSAIISKQRAEAIKTEALNKITAIRDLKADQVEAWLDERIGDINIMATDSEVKGLEAVSKPAYWEREHPIVHHVTGLLTQFKTNYRDYDDIFIINPLTGIIELSTDKSLIGTDKSKEPYFSEPVKTKHLFIRDIYYSKDMNRPTMTISLPVFGNEQSDTIIGILVTRLDLKAGIYDLLLKRTGMGQSGETLIVNRDVVALNDLRWHPNAPLNLKIHAQPAVLASQGKTGTIETTDYRGEKVLAAYTHIPRMKWGFVSKMDLREIYGPIPLMYRNIAFIVIVTLFIVYGISTIIARRIARPVIEMAGTAEKIMNGELGARSRVESSDELGLLASVFNTMTDSVSSQIAIQKGIFQVVRSIVGAKTLNDFRNTVIKELMDITGAEFCACHVLNTETGMFEHAASIGINTDLLDPFNASTMEGEIGQALSSGTISVISDIPDNTKFSVNTIAGKLIPKEIVTIPIHHGTIVSDIISLGRVRPFSESSMEIIKLVSLGISTTLSNLMANKATKDLAEELNRKNTELLGKTREMEKQAVALREQSEELQRQNEELEIQRVKVQEASRLKSEFLSNMSHELRTPLNSVMALSKVLKMQTGKKLSEEEKNYLEIIERNGKNLLTLINDILDLSKIEAGRMDLSPKRFSITSVIETIFERLEALAEEAGVEMVYEFPDYFPEIESDELRVHQILQNLIGNALKFTKQGSVSVSVELDNSSILVIISDTGIGISPKDLPYIFDEFRQVDGSSARRFEGTGLGLAIANKTARMLGGSIDVTSTPGKGSTFTLTLPATLKGIVSDAGKTAPAPDEPAVPERKTVLVVEDNIETNNLICDYLKSEGYHVLSAFSGKESVRLAQLHKPFAITLDILMPDMDGWEVLQELKLNPETAGIPVIIISVSDDRETGVALGAVGYITKPLSRDALLKEIGKLPGAGPWSILVVDDNPFERNEMVQHLRAEGYGVLEADTGTKALSMIDDHSPGLIVLDLVMPDMNGFAVLEHIRKHPGTKHLPVIIVTAKDLTEKELEQLRVNASTVLMKSETSSSALLLEIRGELKGLDAAGSAGERLLPVEDTNTVKMMMGSETKVSKTDDGFRQARFKQGKTAGGAQALPDVDIVRVSKPTILVVEDNPDNMITIEAILGKRYTLIKAFNGKQGIEKTHAEPPDVILLDMALPDMDGYDVVRHIKSNPAIRNIPVIALTAQAMKGDRDAIMNAGCDDYHAKPIDPDTLVRIIETHLKEG